MRFPPLSVIATWPKPNYTNPVTRGPALLIIELTFLPITLLIVSLRIYVRRFIIRKLWWDDWLILAASLPCVGLTLSVVLATTLYGWDVHIWDVPMQKYAPSRKVSFAGQFMFSLASGLTKLSILTFYLRLSSAASTPIFRRAVYASIVFVTMVCIGFTLLLTFQCNPISGYWNLFSKSHHCIPESPPLILQCSFNLGTDLLVFLLPMPTLWAIQLPLRQRIGLIGIFALGGLVCIAGVFRLYYVNQVLNHTYDVTWEGFTLWIWVAVEIDVGIACASIPALKPLFAKFFDKKGSTNYSSELSDRMNRSKNPNISHSSSRNERDSALLFNGTREYGVRDEEKALPNLPERAFTGGPESPVPSKAEITLGMSWRTESQETILKEARRVRVVSVRGSSEASSVGATSPLYGNETKVETIRIR